MIEGRSSRRSACDLCREYKVKCSADKPACDRCIRQKKTCTFSATSGRQHAQTQEFRANEQIQRNFQDKFIVFEPVTYLRNARVNRQPLKQQLEKSKSSNSNNNNSEITSCNISPRPNTPIKNSIKPSQQNAQPLFPSEQSLVDSRQLSNDEYNSHEQAEAQSSNDESWNWEVPTDHEVNLPSPSGDLVGNLSTELPWTTDWSSLIDSSAVSECQILPQNTATSILTSEEPKSRTPSVIMDHAALRPGLVASPSIPCNCMESITASVFELNHQTGSDSHRHMVLGEFLTLHRDRMSTFDGLCSRCLSRPEFAQLLIVNLEQLARLQENMHRSLMEDISLISVDTIVVGTFVIDDTPDRAAITRQLLELRKAKFTSFLESLRFNFMVGGNAVCYNRLTLIVERLNKI